MRTLKLTNQKLAGQSLRVDEEKFKSLAWSLANMYQVSSDKMLGGKYGH